jgi:hypothetical protein
MFDSGPQGYPLIMKPHGGPQGYPPERRREAPWQAKRKPAKTPRLKRPWRYFLKTLKDRRMRDLYPTSWNAAGTGY